MTHLTRFRKDLGLRVMVTEAVVILGSLAVMLALVAIVE